MYDSMPFLRLLCIAGSKVGETEILPQIPRELKIEIQKLISQKITKWVSEAKPAANKEVRIISPRSLPAYSIAMMIRDQINCSASVSTNEKLVGLEWRDPVLCGEILEHLHAGNDRNYPTDPAFHDAHIFETQEELRIRWYVLLSELIRQALAKTAPTNIMLISSPELFYPITSELFHADLPRQMEAVELSVFRDGEMEVILHGRFREKTKSAYYNIEGLSLIGNS